MAKSSKPNYGAWALKFIGSLVYLYVLYQLWVPGSVSGTFGPILFGVAAVASVALFITNLAALTMSRDDKMSMWLAKLVNVGGFALLAAAYVGPAGMAGSLLSEALVGFVIAYIGTGMDMNK
jgi:hypothetical protein